MNKSLTFQEVIAQIKEGETYICTTDEWWIEEIHRNEACIDLTFSDKKNDNGETYQASVNLQATFTKKQTPVTFMEALNSGKNIRVEHKLLQKELQEESSECDEEYIEMNYKYLKNGGYLNVSGVLTVIGWLISQDDIADVVNNGEWYLEN